MCRTANARAPGIWVVARKFFHLRRRASQPASLQTQKGLKRLQLPVTHVPVEQNML